jgi:hypothetical protein
MALLCVEAVLGFGARGQRATRKAPSVARSEERAFGEGGERVDR